VTDYPESAARFARETRGHEMTVLHDDGLYRHLRFSSSARGYGEYWFDLITWPGRLAICGDVGDGYIFSRLPDMFEFFRADRRWGINPHYWAEKLGGGRRSVKTYSEELLRQLVTERFVEDARYNGGVPAGTGKALRTWVLDEDLSDEHTALRVLEDFAHQGYEFRDDLWEWDFHDYESQFLWCCHAIVWGIARYDRVRNYGLQRLAVGDLVASAVAEDRCLKAPAGCGKPLVADDDTTRVFWDEDEAARYEKEWRTTGLCPDCQDLAKAATS
jgi:hypothetical protein